MVEGVESIGFYGWMVDVCFCVLWFCRGFFAKELERWTTAASATDWHGLRDEPGVWDEKHQPTRNLCKRPPEMCARSAETIQSVGTSPQPPIHKQQSIEVSEAKPLFVFVCGFLLSGTLSQVTSRERAGLA